MPRSLGPAFAALRSVFANPDIRRAEAAWTLSYAAEWAWLVALFVYAFAVGGVASVGLVGVVRTLPAAALAPALSGVGDRLPRQRLLLAVHGTRALLIAVAAGSVGAGWPPAVVFIIAPLDGLLGVLHRPTHMALIPSLARAPEELVASNVASSTLEGFGTLLGPAIGGALVATGQTALTFGVPALCFALAAASVQGIGRVQWRHPSPQRHWLDIALGGLRTLGEYPHAGLLLGLFGAQILVRGVLNVLLVAASVEVLRLGEQGVGYLSAAIGAGGLVGALLAVSLVGRARLAPAVMLGLLLWGIPISVTGIVPAPGLALAAMAVLGGGNAVLDIAGYSLLQRTLPNAVRARVFGLLEAIVMLGLGIGSALAPALVSVLGLRGALIATGALLPLLAVASWPRVRRVDTLAVIPARQMELLRGVPMFHWLPLTLLEQVAVDLVEVHFPAGTRIIGQGDVGDRFYVISAGSAEASIDGRPIRVMRPGDSFGEIALLRDVPRTASVAARSEVTAYAIEREAFRAAIFGDRESLAAAEAVVDARLGRA